MSEATTERQPLLNGERIWQGLATGIGGALLASVLGVNKLEERSVADQRSIAVLTTEVRSLSSQVQSLSIHVARVEEQLKAMPASRAELHPRR